MDRRKKQDLVTSHILSPENVLYLYITELFCDNIKK